MILLLIQNLAQCILSKNKHVYDELIEELEEAETLKDNDYLINV